MRRDFYRLCKVCGTGGRVGLAAGAIALAAQPACAQSGPARAALADEAAVAAAYPPSWDTQKQARVWSFTIPAPRGQICDRNGEAFALQRIGYNLALSFPRPLEFNDPAIVDFVQQETAKLSQLLGRSIKPSKESALRHYRNRALLPWIVLQNLSDAEQKKIRDAANPHWELVPFYARTYPNGTLAGHTIGYVGRAGRFLEGPVENNEPLFPESEGREGLEKTFDQVLRGENGQLNVTYNNAGKKASEQVAVTPVAGKSVITTIDMALQRSCEKALAAGTKRGAMVVVDPQNGEILALASWPPIDPSRFIPAISEADYNALKKDPSEPLFPRHALAAYPPGSTFKCFVGMAAMASGVITPGDVFDCPTGWQIGDRVFKNWKKEGTGYLNFSEALEQSCNTWFYQVGLKMGSQLITDYATNAGFGEKTGIPIPDESTGLIPTEAYMRAKHGVRLTGGQLAMLAIGQGSLEITPLQMAQGMMVIANGGTLYQLRLVQQIQDVTGEVVNAFPKRVRRRIEIPAETMAALRLGMKQVVEGSRGTAHQAKVDKVTVVGKTGTAQWRESSTVAWFAGFAPAEGPRLAFAVVYEGDPDRNDVHGGSHAAPIAGQVLREYFKDPAKQKPAKIRDEEGNEIELPVGPPPKVVPVQPPEPAAEPSQQETAPPPPAPKKPSLWKRLFG